MVYLVEMGEPVVLNKRQMGGGGGGGGRRVMVWGMIFANGKYMVGVAERKTEQRKLQTVAGREALPRIRREVDE